MFAAAEGIAGFDQAADVVVAVAPFTPLRVDALDQLSGDNFRQPAVALRVDVLIDLVQWPPVIVITAAEVVRDEGFTGFQVVLEPVLFTIAAPVANHPPLVIGLGLQQWRQAVGRTV
ncbi:hypothetical protein D3C80_1011110 [compost metagenome]